MKIMEDFLHAKWERRNTFFIGKYIELPNEIVY